jgi:hypothetical protein
VFYDFETTQDTKFSENATEHIPNLVCVQQFSSVRQMQDDIDIDSERCGKCGIHSSMTLSEIYPIWANRVPGGIRL